MSTYFYRDKSGREIGPFDLVTLSKFRFAGVLDSDTPVRVADSAEWKPCREVVADLPTPSTAPPAKEAVKKSSNGILIALIGIVIVVIIATRSSTRSPNAPPGKRQTVQSLREKAEKGDADAQYKLGKMYFYGESVETNNAEAVQWFQKSADQGYAPGQNALGTMYDAGRGVAKDESEAARWFQKAVDQGNAKAQANLGRMYWLGRGIEKNSAKAVSLFQKSADAGEKFGQRLLGLAYANGDGVEKNEIKAAIWFQKAADQGDVLGEERLAYMYENGQGVPRDVRIAVDWYRKAAMAGDKYAESRLHILAPTPEEAAKAARIECVSNLKQIGIAFRLWEGDHNDQYPHNVRIASGGTMEYCDRASDGFDRNAFHHFQVMSNELSTTKLLVCPSDVKKRPTIDFAHLRPENISYQLRSGVNVNEANPQEILAICPIHHNVLYADGSAAQLPTQQVSEVETANLREAKAISQANACINMLRQIDAAANEVALEKAKRTGDPISFPSDLTPYIKLTGDGKIPPCPSGGIYTIKRVGDTPTCSLGTTVTPNHVLP